MATTIVSISARDIGLGALSRVLLRSLGHALDTSWLSELARVCFVVAFGAGAAVALGELRHLLLGR